MSKYGRRSRQDSSENLPEWASEDTSPIDNRGGSFDAAGKFQAIDKSSKMNPPVGRDDVDDEGDEDWLHEEASPSFNRPTTVSNVESKNLVEDDEPHFEDEEVDVDDLPSELKRDTLEQREREKITSSNATTSAMAKAEEVGSQLHLSTESSRQQHSEVVDEVARQSVEEPILWIYLDPQGNTQGPFSSADMLDWFNAGYFPQDLMLRRNIDRRFIQLGEMTKRYGRIPFVSGGNVPAPLQEVEPQPPQLPAEHEDKHRQQQALLFQQQLHHQLLVNQQLMQQQQLFILQQQQQGASPAAVAMAAQQLAEHQKQQQTLLAKLMQLTLMPQQVLPQSQPVTKEFSSSPSPLDFISPAELLQHRPQQQQQQHPPVTAPFEMPKATETSRQQPQQQSGHDFASGFGGNSSAAGSGNGNGSYDAIKSLLSQLHESTNEYQSQPTTSIFGNSSATIVNSGSGFSGYGATSQQPQLPTSRPGSGQVSDFSEPASHRSIWDMPVSSLREEQQSPPPKVRVGTKNVRNKTTGTWFVEL